MKPANMNTLFSIKFYLSAVILMGALSEIKAAEPGKADLDDLLRATSLDLLIDNVRKVRPAPLDGLKTCDRLSASPDLSIAACARAARKGSLNRCAAVAMEEAHKKDIKKVIEAHGPNAGDVVDVIASTMFGPSELQLSEAARRGETAVTDAIRAERDAAQQRLFDKVSSSFAQIAASRFVMEPKLKSLRSDANRVEGDAVSDLLRPALRARSGEKLATVPLKLSFGFPEKNQAIYGIRFDQSGMLTITSMGKQNYSRVTILLELSSQGKKSSFCMYIPVLKPSSYVAPEFIPGILDWYDDKTKTFKTMLPDYTLRYNVWADQFQCEDIVIQPIGGYQAELEYLIQAVVPGSEYITPDFGNGRFGGKQYKMKFKKLSAAKDGYRIELELSQIGPLRRGEKPPTRTYKGAVVLNLPKPPKDPSLAIRLRDKMMLSASLTSSSEKWGLTILRLDDGSLVCEVPRITGFPANGETFEKVR